MLRRGLGRVTTVKTLDAFPCKILPQKPKRQRVECAHLGKVRSFTAYDPSETH